MRCSRRAVRAVILALEARVAVLEAEVRDLRAQLALDSTTSSLPPSADPPGTVRPPKPKSGRKRGGQPGHPGHFRRLLPVEQVDHVVEHRPWCCRRCGISLADARAVGKPVRHQVTELPPVRAEVTEHRCVRLACPGCGARTRAALPAAVEGHTLGPRLSAFGAMLTGQLRLSRRQVQGLLRDLLGPTAPSLGSVDRLVAEAGCALRAPYRQIRRAVRTAPVAGVDETGWRLRGARRRSWAAVTPQATLFRLVPDRSRAAFHRLLGRDYPGILTSDRYGAYPQHPLERRPLCWAHLEAWGGRETQRLFALWHRFREGVLSRADLQRQMSLVSARFARLLDRGAASADRKAKALCRNLNRQWPALWTFVYEEGVEPTNNAAERALRHAVLWRKTSFGSSSGRGLRTTERLLSVNATARQQQQNVLEFLTQAISAHRSGQPAPLLLTH